MGVEFFTAGEKEIRGIPLPIFSQKDSTNQNVDTRNDSIFEAKEIHVPRPSLLVFMLDF